MKMSDSGSIEVLATGDMFPSSAFAASDTSAQVWNAFAGADHVFANLETVLTRSESAADKLICMRSAPELIEDFVAANVSVVTLANNHAFDFGLQGLHDTLRALASASLPATGAGENVTDALTPAVLSSGGGRTAFLGMSATLPAGSAAGKYRGGVAPLRVITDYVVDPVVGSEEPAMAPFVHTIVAERDAQQACEAVAAASRSAELVVVALHWGVSSGLVPASQGWLATYQQPLARRLIDAGADAIVGHHPHVLQGIESYRGRPIFYSLGNLLFHSDREVIGAIADWDGAAYDWSALRGEGFRLGGVARLVRGRGGQLRASIRFVVLDESGEPRWAEGVDAERARGFVTQCSALFGTTLQTASDGRSLTVDLINEGNRSK